MDLRQVFINNLKKYRKEQKLSQMKLADLCGTSASYIGEIEIGKKFPSIEMIQKFSEAMNIQPYKLLMTENDFFAPVLIQDKKLKLIEKLQHSIQDIIEQEEF
ncbi:helix-turn-helix transcriptional regulator [uncultured Treponema sp.]|uniref:helix-turn-helix domain-containing protein n=1 Tax=uncultured Treponema sp. TaxID=162155 RepID=UPI0025CD6AE7|nr:helix-turn-helix transcriptional regulator [uncultured Treponema sp.]